MGEIGHNSSTKMNVPRELEFAVMYSNLTPQARHIIHVLAKLMSRDGRGCSPSVDTLSEFTGMHRTTILKKLKEVDEWGRIEREIKFRGAGTLYTPNTGLILDDIGSRERPINDVLLNSLVAESDQALVAESDQENTPWSLSTTSLVAESDPTKDSTKDIKEKYIKENSKTSENDKNQKQKKRWLQKEVEEKFELFWKACPRKIGKVKSREKFEELIKWKKDKPPLCTPEILTAAMQTFASKQVDTEERFIPHPATWLNQGRWVDETQRSETYHWETNSDAYRKLPTNRWINAITAANPNGHWPIEKFGPYIDEPGCLMPDDVKAFCVKQFGNKYLKSGAGK